jgi:hypothetical protein
MNEKKCNICQKYIANEGGPMFCMLKQTPSDTCGYKRISDSKPEATPTPPDDEVIREAFEKEPMFQPWLKHARYTELGFYKPLKESKYTKAVSSKLNDSLDGFEIGFKDGAASRDEEVERLEKHFRGLIDAIKSDHKKIASGLNDMLYERDTQITALKAEIESMRCCGNCGDTQKCSMNNGRGTCDNWKPKC